MKATGNVHLILSPGEYRALVDALTKEHNPNIPEREPAFWHNNVPYDKECNAIPMKVDVEAAKQRVAIKRKIRAVGIRSGLITP
jgi:hypothetical protein